MKNGTLRYKALDEFSQIMELFDEPAAREKGVNEISKSLGVLPSKVSRMLKTLESGGWVEKNVHTGKYSIGARFLQLGILYAFNHPLRRIVLPHLYQTARDLNLLSTWGIFKNGRITVIDSIRMKDAPLIHLLGSNVPLHSSSFGKLFLAYSSDGERKRILDTLTFQKLTSKTIATRESMEEELKSVQEQGYALDKEETQEGLVTVTAPVFDDSHTIVAALCIAGPSSEFSEDLDGKISYLKEKGTFISYQLGYRMGNLPPFSVSPSD
jgi:IclR family transcriptional regulator, KDG regulon repressor